MWLRHYSLDFMPHILTKVVQGNTALAADVLKTFRLQNGLHQSDFFSSTYYNHLARLRTENLEATITWEMLVSSNRCSPFLKEG